MYLEVKNNIFTNKLLRGQKVKIEVRLIYLKVKVYKAVCVHRFQSLKITKYAAANVTRQAKYG